MANMAKGSILATPDWDTRAQFKVKLKWTSQALRAHKISTLK